MNYWMIIVGIVGVLCILKFIKTLGKITFLVLLGVCICFIMVGVFGINPLELLEV